MTLSRRTTIIAIAVAGMLVMPTLSHAQVSNLDQVPTVVPQPIASNSDNSQNFVEKAASVIENIASDAINSPTPTSPSQDQNPNSTVVTTASPSDTIATTSPMDATSSDVITDPNPSPIASTTPASTVTDTTPTTPVTPTPTPTKVTKTPVTKATKTSTTKAVTTPSVTLPQSGAQTFSNTSPVNYYAGVAFSPTMTRILLTSSAGMGVMGLALVTGAVEWIADGLTKRRPVLEAKLPKSSSK